MVNEVTNPTTSLREVSGWTDIIDESVHTSVNVLWLSISEETVKANYERDATPDPSTYYVKGEEDEYTGTQWKEFARMEPRYKAPTYSIAPRRAEEPLIYRCVLCDTTFRTDEEFSRHAAAH
jgi:hypothetical protein